MTLRTQEHRRITTKNPDGTFNGYLVPIYNIYDGFFAPGHEAQQVYLTVVAPRSLKGLRPHDIRTGCFTCIKGNVRFIVKPTGGYQE